MYNKCMKTRKKEKQIAEKILTKVMESGMLLNGNGHFAVREIDGRITTIEIYNSLFSSESKIKEIHLYIAPYGCWGEKDKEVLDIVLRLYRKDDGSFCPVFLQKEESEVLRKFLEYIDENKYQILQCNYEHGCSLFVTDTDFI